MRIVYMGSAEIARPSLKAVVDSPHDEVIAVLTQPDRPKGRKQQLAACPLKEYALELGLPVLNPEKVGSPETCAQLQDMEPDLFIVVAYGQYIPQRVIDIAPHQAINVHPSLLPKYRGAAPIQWAIADGHTETGVTILYVSRKMDAGDIILQQKAEILPDDTAVTLSTRLGDLAGQMIRDVLDMHRAGDVPRTPQDEAAATCVHKLEKEDGVIDWTMDATVIHNRARGFQPWPCCSCEVPKGNDQRVRVLTTRVESGKGEPGQVLDAAGDGPLIAAGQGALRLVQVQPPGKKPMPGSAFLCGHPLRVGDMLG